MQRRRFTIEFKQQVIQEANEVGNAAQVTRHTSPKHKSKDAVTVDRSSWTHRLENNECLVQSGGAPIRHPLKSSFAWRRKQTAEGTPRREDLEVAVLRDLLKKAMWAVERRDGRVWIPEADRLPAARLWLDHQQEEGLSPTRWDGHAAAAAT